MNKKQLFIIFLGLALTVGYFSSVHNIDLSWNVKHLELDDCNGIICQDVTSMYQKSIYFMWMYPMFMIFMLICYVRFENE